MFCIFRGIAGWTLFNTLTMGYMDVTQIKFEINFLKYVLDTFIFKGSDLYFLI